MKDYLIIYGILIVASIFMILAVTLVNVDAQVRLDPKPTVTTMTVNEWQEITKMYDYEIKKVNGMELANVRSKPELFLKLNAKIRTREVKETVALRDIRKEDYISYRESLLTKSDNIWTR